MYSPLIGQFAQRDPLGYAAGDANLLRYCGNRAVSATDPMGLEEYKVKRGTFDVTMQPDKNLVEVIIKFTPGKECLPCKVVRFVQIARLADSNGVPIDWKKAIAHTLDPVTLQPITTQGAEGDINEVRTTDSKDSAGNKITGGWNIDYLPSKLTKVRNVTGGQIDKPVLATPFYDQYVTYQHKWGANPPVQGREYAQMWDKPQSETARRFEFETYAVKVERGLSVLGGISWGFTLDASNTPILDKVETRDNPSPTFMAALNKFNEFYHNEIFDLT